MKIRTKCRIINYSFIAYLLVFMTIIVVKYRDHGDERPAPWAIWNILFMFSYVLFFFMDGWIFKYLSRVRFVIKQKMGLKSKVFLPSLLEGTYRGRDVSVTLNNWRDNRDIPLRKTIGIWIQINQKYVRGIDKELDEAFPDMPMPFATMRLEYECFFPYIKGEDFIKDIDCKIDLLEKKGF